MSPESIKAIAAGSIYAFVVVALSVHAIKLARQTRRASRWPTVSGRILSAELQDGPSTGGLIPIATHRAIIRYAYEVGGQEWVSQRVFFGDEVFRTGDAARDRVRQYEPDTRVEVSYDPDDPSRAVLEPRTAWVRAAQQTVIWVGLVILSIVVLVFARAHATS